MAILKTLFKTLTGSVEKLSFSASHLVRYRQSFKLRDALIELEDHGYTSLFITNGTLESIDDDTDLTQCIDIVQIVIRKSLKLIIVSEKSFLRNYSDNLRVREFINKRLSELGISTKDDGLLSFLPYLAELGAAPWPHPFLRFSDSINTSSDVKKRQEISTKRMIEIILEAEEWHFKNGHRWITENKRNLY